MISRNDNPKNLFESIFDPRQQVSTGVIPRNLKLGEFAAFLRSLVDEANSIEPWIACARWQGEMRKAGLSTSIDELQRGLYDATEATNAVCARFYQQLFDYYAANDPQLDGFDGVRHEQVRENFRQLSKAGGERRLNVAVTRAREEVVLIASVKAADMDLSGSTSTGAHLLKAYFEFAERGVDTLGRSISETVEHCESPFEAEVAAALMRHGLEPVPQVGCGGFRIDLALKHPEHPGVYSLGIECDGANFHSSRTARDQDRNRQSILEDLGWQICRVWSTDWVRNPNAQLQRILTAYEQALAVPFTPDWTASKVDSPEFDYLQPEYQNREEPTVRTYLNIDEVPENEIAEVSLRILSRTGAVDWSDLVIHMARELGFARTGKKIRERFEKALHDQ